MSASQSFLAQDDKITSSQAALVLNNTMLGAGILTLPRSVSETVKTPDSWISVLLGGLIVMLVVVLMVKLSLRFPGKTVYQYTQIVIGRYPGILWCLLLVLYYIAIAGFEIRAMSEVTMFYLLEGTPIWAITIPFIWVGAYLVRGGINAIARVGQIVFPISLFILIVSYLLSLRLFHLDNLRPVLGNGIFPVIQGLKSTVLVYSGCEVVMTLVAKLDNPKQALKAMLIGISIPAGLYFITIIMVIGGLSIDSAVTSTWPTIDLIRSFEITGFLFERFEFPLMVIWLMQMFCNYSSFFYNSSLGVSQLFNLPYKSVIFALIPFIFLAAMVPKNINEVFMLGDDIGYFSILLFILFPVSLTLIALIRSKGGPQHEKS
ncbi:GerAB/ArcD/ProY family transporter [Paenibacillus sp. JDR-2]|uniref:GerAB/ArcD/ProY family transporter n=1 Tax=Paenibacillus sp. (strain JDR-2) TaxID=324057 RepID=UPI0001663E8F|nr:GerAB/ArcD/ProY family transporter [Paenibacillus sp. JDR-2]ACT02832.1 spore germination protein [Paenibacillus sp. JDR-2]